jgi:hypothetical protein
MPGCWENPWPPTSSNRVPCPAYIFIHHHYEQRTHSYLIYNPNVRVYPSFFQLAVNVLDLSLAEQQALLQAWLSLADEGIRTDHLEEESFGGSEG